MVNTILIALVLRADGSEHGCDSETMWGKCVLSRALSFRALLGTPRYFEGL